MPGVHRYEFRTRSHSGVPWDAALPILYEETAQDGGGIPPKTLFISTEEVWLLLGGSEEIRVWCSYCSMWKSDEAMLTMWAQRNTQRRGIPSFGLPWKGATLVCQSISQSSYCEQSYEESVPASFGGVPAAELFNSVLSCRSLEHYSPSNCQF